MFRHRLALRIFEKTLNERRSSTFSVPGSWSKRGSDLPQGRGLDPAGHLDALALGVVVAGHALDLRILRHQIGVTTRSSTATFTGLGGLGFILACHLKITRPRV